jgi:hypothetical protein
VAKAYYSTVFDQSAPEVWKIVRDFNTYPVWVNGAAGLVREMARIAAQDAGRLCPPGSSQKTRLHRISGDLGAVSADFGKSPSIAEYPADSGSRTSCCIRGPHLA